MFYKKLVNLHSLIITLLFILGCPNAYCGLWCSNDDSAEGTTVNFTITERANVYEDTLTASLTVAEDNKDPKELQNNINQKMQAALELVKKFPQVESKTEYYNVYQNSPIQNTDGKKENPTWHGSQQITLKSKSQEDLLNLAGQLQEQGLLMQDLSFKLSVEVNEKTKDDLLDKTIAKLQDKAKLLVKLLNKGKATIVEINIDNNNYPQPMLNRAVMLGSTEAANPTPPVAQPAKVEVQLTISAKILIE